MKHPTRSTLIHALALATGLAGLALTLAGCDLPPDDAANSSTGAETDAPTTGEDSTGEAEVESTSTGGSSGVDLVADGDTTTSGGGWGGDDSGEPAPSCFADPCEVSACGSGLVCLPHPTSGERLCVTPCDGPPYVCNAPAACSDPGPVACLAVGAIMGCFPV